MSALSKSSESEQSRKSLTARALTGASFAFFLAVTSFIASGAQEEGKVFELRTYTGKPGKLANLHARFPYHTTRICRKHGKEVVAY